MAGQDYMPENREWFQQIATNTGDSALILDIESLSVM